jgi:predicted Zn-ribbon and HTH transcriptional regulator
MNNKIEQWTCKRCDHEWYARKPGRPVMCPKCKSYYHDEPRKEKS